MNMSKSRDIQAKMPSPKVIYASNESKSVLARNLEECRDNDKNSQSVFLSFKCILARNCEGTEQLLFFKKLSVFVFRLKDRRVFLILLQNHLALFTPERSTAGFFTDTGLASIDVYMIRLAYLLSVIGTIMGCTSDLNRAAAASACISIGHSGLFHKT